jgi:hypothetical protein
VYGAGVLFCLPLLALPIIASISRYPSWGQPNLNAISELPQKRGWLNWSMQHRLGVYWPEFQSPRSFSGVDLSAGATLSGSD